MKEKMKKTFSYTAVFLTGIVACGIALKTWGAPDALLPGPTNQEKQAVLTSLSVIPPVTRGTDNNPIATAAAKLDPSIVTIHTVGTATPAEMSQAPQQQDQGSPFPFNDPFFRQFFGSPNQMAPQQQAPDQGTVRGAASGVIISPDGYILTNNHVVQDTSKITVTINNKSYDAHLIGTDPVTDIAVVKINPGTQRLQPAQLGNSNNIRVGDWAIAVGNPLDIGTTVTLGIISAVSRTDLQAEGQPLQSVIQTDAAINPGNSGGALADINGDVIGINEAIESPTGYYSGIGFAIPINSARKIAEELIKNGKVVHPYLGISYEPLSDLSKSDKAQFGITIESDSDLVIVGVAARSPASQVGLEPGDVITQINGQPLTSKDELNQLILSHKVGDVLNLSISRNGQLMSVPITLRERPASFNQNSMKMPAPGGQSQPGMP